MTVVDAEIRASWPFFRVNIRPILGWKQISNYRNPVFIIISLNTLMCICCVTSDETVRFGGVFGVFEIFQRVIWIVIAVKCSLNETLELRLNYIMDLIQAVVLMQKVLTLTLDFLDHLIVLACLIDQALLLSDLNLWGSDWMRFGLISIWWAWALVSLFVIFIFWGRCLAPRPRRRWLHARLSCTWYQRSCILWLGRCFIARRSKHSWPSIVTQGI